MDIYILQYFHACCTVGPGSHSMGYLPGVKRPRRESLQLTTSAVFKNKWSYASTGPICLREAKKVKVQQSHFKP